MSQDTFVRWHCFKPTTCFGPCSGPSSGHRSIYSSKLYSESHKIHQSKIQRDLVIQFSSFRILNDKEISLNFRVIYIMTFTV